MGMLPTPTAHQQNTKFKQGGTCLQAKLTMGMLPTPQSRDYKGQQGRAKDGITLDLLAVINNATGKTSQLNPRFVAEMMGFPPNWTELPFLGGEEKV
jgi:hypothetical protein